MLRVSLRRRICKIALTTGLIIYFLQIALKNIYFPKPNESTESSKNALHINTYDSYSRRKTDEMSLKTTNDIFISNQKEFNVKDDFHNHGSVPSDMPGECDSNLTMFIAVMSAPEVRRDRNMIRSLWGHKKVTSKVGAKVVFFIGKCNSIRIQKAIEMEMAQQKDIVQFDLVEDYYNLSSKSLSMLRWFEEHCKNTMWYVKADVDSFWNIHELKSLLESHDKMGVMEDYSNSWKDLNRGHHIASKSHITTQKDIQNSTVTVSSETELIKGYAKSSDGDDHITIVCPRAEGLQVCREFEEDRCEERYVVSKEEYSSDFYPPHCHGFSYVLRRDLVSKILNEDEERSRKGLTRFRMEDVYVTGILLQDTSVEYLDISSQTMSFPKSISEALRRPLLLLHGPERWLLQGSAREIWDHITTNNVEKLKSGKRKTVRSAQVVWQKCFNSKNLWITNTVSCGVLLAAGDGMQQQVERARGVHALPHYDWARTGRLFLVGLSQGPAHHIFYIWLDKVLPKKNVKTVIKKILLDQILAAPFFAITFFLGAGLLEGNGVGECLQEFRRKFPAVYLFDWCIWPPTQAINFYLVPAPYRVLYVNTITVVWDMFLSYMKHFDQKIKTTQLRGDRRESSSCSVKDNESRCLSSVAHPSA